MKRRTLMIIAVGVFALFAAWNVWGYIDRQINTFRLKQTATILVDGVEYTGFSVQEYKLVWNYITGAWRLIGRGEGVTIDVPGKFPVVVQFSPDTVFNNCANRKSQDLIATSLRELLHCEVSFFPVAITFDGSKTVALFVSNESGDPYPYTSMTFDRTNESVTTGVMPLLPSDKKGLIYVPHGDGGVRLMGNLDFKQENYR